MNTLLTRGGLLVLLLGLAGMQLPAVDAPPGFRVALELKPGADNPRNSEGDFIQLKDGRVLFIYTRFTSGSADHARADLACRESTDGGQTWTSRDRIVITNDGGQNIMSVSLLRLATGRIGLFYLRKNSASDCRPVVRWSTDETRTWSAPQECIPNEPGYYVLNNDRVLQLRKGRLLLPLAQHAGADGKRQDGSALCYLSDDQGVNWRRSRGLLQQDKAGKRVNLMEPGVVELRDGRLLMLLRTRLGCLYQSFSTDAGETWSAPEPTQLYSPESPATIQRLPQGPLVLVWNDHRNRPEKDRVARPPIRTPLALALSRDEGKTWEAPVVLESGAQNGYCYTALEVVGSRLLLGYCAHASPWGLETTRISCLDLNAL
ncbi:MAG TPA: sialidase family protein [Bacillota bacterium]|nr:sialidase family protein [Bacillota bacterium]